jgi:hypothetical protein
MIISSVRIWKRNIEYSHKAVHCHCEGNWKDPSDINDIRLDTVVLPTKLYPTRGQCFAFITRRGNVF